MNKEKIERILCPIDFSDQADAALCYAASISEKLGAALTVMHAKRYIPYVESAVMLPESYVEESEKHKQRAMTDLRRYIEQSFPNVQTDYLIVDRYPVDGILEAVSETGADLIVMATTGRSGFKRLVLGSVAEGVMQQAPIPVLTLRPSPEQSIIDVNLQRILVPTNFTEPSSRALREAMKFAEAFDSGLTVVHVIEPNGATGEMTEEGMREWTMEKLPKQREFDVVVREGRPAEQIIRTAQDISADLVVVAAVYRPFLETTIAGTTSERVVRFAPCPVLTVPIRK